MAKSHILGFPRIGAQRELKFSLEAYWKSIDNQEALHKVIDTVLKTNWANQNNLTLSTVGDFSLYDHILDMSFTLGNIPSRATHSATEDLDKLFCIARGRSNPEATKQAIAAGEMTKYFDTNYHYIVPEFDSQTSFSLNPERLLHHITKAKKHTKNMLKPVIIGPLSYLWLGKAKDGTNKLDLLSKILPVYIQLFELLADESIEWVQVDEPILVTELNTEWQSAFKSAYTTLNTAPTKRLITTYFDRLLDNLDLALEIAPDGLHVDAIRGFEDIQSILNKLNSKQVLSLGVIDGRNIWKANLNAIFEWLNPISKTLNDRLWVASSCSLLHTPVDLDQEDKLDPEIKSWLAFAKQKINEVELLTIALNNGKETLQNEFDLNAQAIQSRKNSSRVHNTRVKERTQNITPSLGSRQSLYTKRAQLQRQKLQLPLFPTTTIGSFPQTPSIRQARRQYKNGTLPQSEYIAAMKSEIQHCIKEQEALDLDIFVHGEAERNDMVEYFGEQLDGFIFTNYGWVQSYGSRCVKPPIIYGDISRPKPMTVDWITYASSLTTKPMKGMLTGPVTILNWSFVRDDQARSTTCYQIALAIRDEVQDLEKAGIGIIQIDEAALREGLPLRRSNWKNYLKWAVTSFRIAANGVSDETQIHTHMCYSEFNDIIESIADMDADVITIETSRSDMELLDVFDQFKYPNEIGPGVYDIHSPNIPTQESILNLLHKASERIPQERLWVNPDCGLKTRTWNEVLPALQNMVDAAKELRK